LDRRHGARAEDGQLIAYGRRGRNGVDIHFEAGAGIPAADAEWLREMLVEPLYSILSLLHQAPPNTPFIDDLYGRGYDLATFRLSIHLATAGRQVTERCIRLRARTLHARWGRVPEDHAGDLCCAWLPPCDRRDKNLFFSLVSMPYYTPQECTRGLATARRTLRSELERRGYDIRTFRFEVKQPKALSGAPAA